VDGVCSAKLLSIEDHFANGDRCFTKNMRFLQANANIRRGNWSIDLHSTALYAIAWALVIGLFAFFLRRPREVKSPFAQGTIQDTRIVVDHAAETNWGGQLTWKAEYRVAYSVAGREFTVWADSGIRRQSEADVRLALPQSRRSCRVHYNPQKPEICVADCR
jgi:hypothetical protein